MFRCINARENLGFWLLGGHFEPKYARNRILGTCHIVECPFGISCSISLMVSNFISMNDVDVHTATVPEDTLFPF